MVKNLQKSYEDYDKDFYAWTAKNAQLIREGNFSQVDIKHVAEEIESMGKRERRELISRLIVLIAHLLKWKFQEARRSKSWMLTIKNQRIELKDLLEENPSLKKELEGKMRHAYDAYERAILKAAEESGIDEKKFPKTLPFSLKECLKTSYFPE
jgi:hypothetical protein